MGEDADKKYNERSSVDRSSKLNISCTENLDSLIVNLPAIIFRKCERDKRFYFFNKELQLLTGYQEEDIDSSGISPLTSFIISSNEEVCTQIKTAVAEGKRYKVDYLIKDKTGEKRFFVETGTPIFSENHCILAVEGVIFEKTSDYLKKLELQKSQHILDSTLNSLNDFVHVIDRDYNIIFFNKAFCSIAKELGFNQKVVGQNIKQVFPFLSQKVYDEYDNVFNVSKEVITFEDIDIKGRSFYTETRKIPVVEDGIVIRIVTIIRDLTSSKIAQQTIKENEEKYKFLFNNMNDGLLLHALYDDNTFSNFIEVNSAACTQLAYAREELLRKNPRDINKGGDKQFFLKNIALLRQKKRVSFKSMRQDKFGNVKEYEIDAHLFESNGQMMVLSIARDISEREEYLKEIIKAKEKAEESDLLKSAFLANMSHEIRTPMNGIIGFSDMMSKPTLTDEKRVYYSKIVKESGQQLMGLINDILDISKIETGLIEIKSERVNVNALLLELSNFFMPKAIAKQVTIFTQLGLEHEKSIIISDQLKLKQIVTNLLSNAVKYTSEGKIVVGYKLKNNYLEFFVKDSGIGIEPKYHKKIFERFGQGNSEFTRKYGGTGLGLAITKNLVELMGGAIKVESEPPNGSCFYFTHPYATGFNGDVAEHSQLPTEKESELEFCVLVAENERINYLFIEEVLSDEGVNILHAKDCHQAIEVFKENQKQIGLVLVEISLPNEGGIDVVKGIREYNTKVPIIMQGSYAMYENEEEAMKAGCNGYLSKPIKPSDLRRFVNSYRH